VLSGEAVRRDGLKPGAVLCRAAASHLRVGTFQFAAALSDIEALRSLADYAIARHYPQAREDRNPYLAFLDAVGGAQAKLVARWMGSGFVHGVMNTDNVAISGQAIDFGPCAFLDAYRGDQVFSSIDKHGRYAWGRQASIAVWNHARLAESLLPLLDDKPDKAFALAQESVGRFSVVMEDQLSSCFSRKLGLSARRPGDELLIQGLLSWMESSNADFSATFWALTQKAAQRQAAYALPDEAWLRPWLKRIEGEAAPAQAMTASNPPIHPRNRAVQSALDAAEHGDLGPFYRLAASLARPWDPDSALPELEPPDGAELAPFTTYCGT